MKKSAKSNMYETTLFETWALFEDHLEGQPVGIICIISANTLSDEATNALQNSFSQLGYGKSACTFISIKNTVDERAPCLGAKELFALIEGLDPLFVVITDEQAAELYSENFRHHLPLDKRARIFGREIRAFSCFETMLGESRSKQKAWGLLKSLPKLES